MLLKVDLYFLTNRGTIIFQINAQGNYHYYSFLKLRISLSSKQSIDNASPHDFIQLAMVINSSFTPVRENPLNNNIYFNTY